MELTESDIECFRKEAYMMSRLRHPNIVLVMGISLLDKSQNLQKPRPMSKKMRMDSDEDFMGGAKDKESKPPPKTICIITEYLEQGSLADILYGPSKLPAEVRCLLCYPSLPVMLIVFQSDLDIRSRSDVCIASCSRNALFALSNPSDMSSRS